VIELLPFTEQDFPRLMQWIGSLELMVQWAGALLFTYPLDVGAGLGGSVGAGLGGSGLVGMSLETRPYYEPAKWQ